MNNKDFNEKIRIIIDEAVTRGERIGQKVVLRSKTAEKITLKEYLYKKYSLPNLALST